MASLDEFIASVQSNVSAVDETSTALGASGSVADELVATFQGLAAHGLVDGSLQLKQQVEEAQSLLGPVVAKLEEAIATAEGLKGLSTGATGAVARPAPSPMTSAPAAVREPVAKVGDPVTAPDIAPPDYRQELAGSDDGDSTRSRAQRFGRAFGRRAEQLQKSTKQESKSASAMIKGFKPTNSGTIETVGTPHQPAITSTMADGPPVPDVVGTLVIGGAVCVDAAYRFFRGIKRWRGKT